MSALNGLNVLKLDSGRQELAFFEKVINFSDLAGNSGNPLKAVWIPEGAVLEKVDVVVITAFNSATSDVVVVQWESDGSTVVASTSIAAVSRFAATEANLGQMRAAPDYLDVTWTGVGAIPTAGQFALRGQYSMTGKAQFNAGKDGVPPGIS